MNPISWMYRKVHKNVQYGDLVSEKDVSKAEPKRRLTKMSIAESSTLLSILPIEVGYVRMHLRVSQVMRVCDYGKAPPWGVRPIAKWEMVRYRDEEGVLDRYLETATRDYRKAPSRKNSMELDRYHIAKRILAFEADTPFILSLEIPFGCMREVLSTGKLPSGTRLVLPVSVGLYRYWLDNRQTVCCNVKENLEIQNV